jgi:SAM-dependent methyltransferase
VSCNTEPYLLPYVDAAQRHGGGFGALLWASPRTQRLRFEAIRLIFNPQGKSVLDAGCGRADYLAHLLEASCIPADYIGLEAVAPLAAAAETRARDEQSRVAARILRADFVREPARLFVGADVVTFSGSLNTLDEATFYSTISRAFDATAEALVFNFLSSPLLAGRKFLVWHAMEDVLKFAHTLADDVRVKADYLAGDCTICLIKPRE